MSFDPDKIPAVARDALFEHGRAELGATLEQHRQNRLDPGDTVEATLHVTNGIIGAVLRSVGLGAIADEIAPKLREAAEAADREIDLRTGHSEDPAACLDRAERLREDALDHMRKALQKEREGRTSGGFLGLGTDPGEHRNRAKLLLARAAKLERRAAVLLGEVAPQAGERSAPHRGT